MVEMEVGQDHIRNVAGFHSLPRELAEQSPLGAFDGVDLGKLLRPAGSDTGFHDDRSSATSDKKAVQTEQNAVGFIRLGRALPERLGHDAEHGAAIEFERSVGKEIDLEVTDFHRSTYRGPPSAGALQRMFWIPSPLLTSQGSTISHVLQCTQLEKLIWIFSPVSS